MPTRIFIAKSPLKSAFLIEICLCNIKSCDGCIGWLYICFACERCNMSLIIKGSTRVVATIKKGIKYNNYFALQQKKMAHAVFREQTLKRKMVLVQFKSWLRSLFASQWKRFKSHVRWHRDDFVSIESRFWGFNDVGSKSKPLLLTWRNDWDIVDLACQVRRSSKMEPNLYYSIQTLVNLLIGHRFGDYPILKRKLSTIILIEHLLFNLLLPTHRT